MSQTSPGRALGVSTATPTLDGLSVGSTASGKTATVELGQAVTDLLAFYGVTAIAQRSSSAQTTLSVSIGTSTTSWGFKTSDAFNAAIAQLAEICATLKLTGLWKGS